MKNPQEQDRGSPPLQEVNGETLVHQLQSNGLDKIDMRNLMGIGGRVRDLFSGETPETLLNACFFIAYPELERVLRAHHDLLFVANDPRVFSVVNIRAARQVMQRNPDFFPEESLADPQAWLVNNTKLWLHKGVCQFEEADRNLETRYDLLSGFEEASAKAYPLFAFAREKIAIIQKLTADEKLKLACGGCRGGAMTKEEAEVFLRTLAPLPPDFPEKAIQEEFFDGYETRTKKVTIEEIRHAKQKLTETEIQIVLEWYEQKDAPVNKTIGFLFFDAEAPARHDAQKQGRVQACGIPMLTELTALLAKIATDGKMVEAAIRWQTYATLARRYHQGHGDGTSS